jgi:hypothetical protein
VNDALTDFYYYRPLRREARRYSPEYRQLVPTEGTCGARSPHAMISTTQAGIKLSLYEDLPPDL